MRAFLWVALLLFCAGCAQVGRDFGEHIGIEARINDKPVRLAIDTGASDFFIWQHVAKRLGLKVHLPPSSIAPPPGRVLAGVTAARTVEIEETRLQNVRLRTVPVPAYLSGLPNVDGVVGWPNMAHNIFAIDGNRKTLRPLREVPAGAKSWTRWRIRPEFAVLVVEVPVNGTTRLLFIDTGAGDGISIPGEAWRKWKLARPRIPSTLNRYFSPQVGGLDVREMAWAEDYSIGSLNLTDVVVSDQHPAMGAGLTATGDLYLGTIGMGALKRMDAIMDGKNGWIYVRAKRNAVRPPAHNTLGLTFIPDPSQGNVLVARVAPGSPAALAGFRDDDVLLKVGDRDMARWNRNPETFALASNLQWKAGTRGEFTIRRNQTVHRIPIVSQNLLGPSAGARR